MESLAPGSRVVKCFNHTGYTNLVDSRLEPVKPVMFAAGDDE
jgi:predicted dinucleotide-binding enzyme